MHPFVLLAKLAWKTPSPKHIHLNPFTREREIEAFPFSIAQNRVFIANKSNASSLLTHIRAIFITFGYISAENENSTRRKRTYTCKYKLCTGNKKNVIVLCYAARTPFFFPHIVFPSPMMILRTFPFIKRDVFAQKLIGLKFQNEIAYMCGWRYWDTETGRKKEIQTARERESEMRYVPYHVHGTLAHIPIWPYSLNTNAHFIHLCFVFASAEVRILFCGVQCLWSTRNLIKSFSFLWHFNFK